MERYTDEKHPETVYQVIDVVERQQPKPKRPVWRRALRVLLTCGAIFFFWCTFVPHLHVMRHRCNSHRNHLSNPGYDVQPPFEMDKNFSADDDETPIEHYTFPSDLKSFWIKQDSFLGPTRTQVTGNLIVHSCSKAKNISAHFKFELSDPSLRSSIVVEPHEDGILFKLDPFSLLRKTVNATIFLVIPKGDDYSLDSLRVGTVELPIRIKDTVTTKIDTSEFSTVSAPIASYGKAKDEKGLDIHSLKLKTVSGNIKGEFPLNHALDLETTSGDIIVDIVSSDLPEEIGWLKTSTVSGVHDITFVSKLNPRPLYSTHHSVSGEIGITYPEDWQGGLKLKTTSGHIDVEGKGTEVVKKKTDPVGRFWKVVKGEGKSKGSISTVSGKIDLLIGEKEDDEK